MNRRPTERPTVPFALGYFHIRRFFWSLAMFSLCRAEVCGRTVCSDVTTAKPVVVISRELRKHRRRGAAGLYLRCNNTFTFTFRTFGRRVHSALYRCGA